VRYIPNRSGGVFQDQEGGYQLFVVSPRLEPWQLASELAGEYDSRLERPMQDKSHIAEWLRRVDPTYVPGQPAPETSLAHYLNPTEASEANNWGWDKTGSLFPLDVEVVTPCKDKRSYDYDSKPPHYRAFTID